jgi:hypothetical protein
LGYRKDGKLLFAKLENVNIKITHIDIEFAYKNGYVIYIISAVLCDTVTKPYEKYIKELYK